MSRFNQNATQDIRTSPTNAHSSSANTSSQNRLQSHSTFHPGTRSHSQGIPSSTEEPQNQTNQSLVRQSHSHNSAVRQEYQTQPVANEMNHFENSNTPKPRPEPIWDRERRELRLGDKLVKRFRWPATNQEKILNAFQDQGWPRHVSDPLDVDPKICPKRRLHDTLKCLNRKQLVGLIKFRGDGTGQGVLLEINLEPPREPVTQIQ